VSAEAELTVVDNPSELRYELRRGPDLVGQIRYAIEPGLVVLIHTEVAEAVEGQGLGSVLVRGALDDIRARGLRVAPVCPFVLSYLERHPEYADLVEPDPPRWD
jgi:predicted GNAT family acetyltransferase